MKTKPDTSLDLLTGSSAGEVAALAELDMKTNLLNYRTNMLTVLRRKRKPVDDGFQWPIVTALTKPNLRPTTVFWLAFKRGAVPDIVFLAFIREVANYIVERVFPQSSRAWRIAAILGRRMTPAFSLERCEEAKQLAEEMYATHENVDEQKAIAALSAGAETDPREAAILLTGFVVDARKALRLPDEGCVVHLLAKKLRELCQKALEQHPQKDVLKKQI